MINCTWGEKIWENGWEAGSSRQISLPRLGPPLDRSSSFTSPSVPMKRLSRPLILTAQSCERLSDLDHICSFITFTFSTGFSLFISFYIICFSNPPPPTRPSSSYTLGSELTWAPGTIFSLSQCLPLVCAGVGELRDVPTAHSAHFLSPNMVKKKKKREREKKKTPARPHCWKSRSPLLSGMLLI